MTGYQRARRLYFLRGSVGTIAFCTFLMLLGAMADCIAK